MSRQTVLKAALLLCAVILLAGVLLGIKTVIGFAGYSYANAGKYTSGDAEISKAVSNLDIDWLDGTVIILYHNGHTVELSERSDGSVSENLRMRWRLDGDTLRIRYSKPGRLPKRLPNKELTVMLPEDIALNDVAISAASAAVSIPAIHADHLDLDVTSGNINAAAKVKTVSAETTSGHIDLHITDSVKEVSAVTTSGSVTIDAGNADRFTAESTSGSIRVTLKNVGDFKASSTSGDIFAEILKAKQADFDSTSGDMQLSISKLGSLKMETTSGSVQAALPSIPGFTADLETASGQINYKLPLTKQGGSYVCGDGSGEVEIHTTSGSITISEVIR